MTTRTAVRSHGFTLIEVLIALALLIALCAGASTLLAIALDAIDRSRQREMALVLARAKLEQLVSLTSSVPSPSDSLSTSHAGYVDYLDAHGQPLDAAGWMYVRRWSIERRGSGASELLIVQVMVTPRGRRDREAAWISGARLRRGA
jgi:prepilin-type N-terminal cleavage/methylation domain-containing protein